METIKHIGLILLAAVLLAALSLPLANTEWAEGMRSDTGEGEMEGDRMGDMPAAMRYIMPLVKTLVVMGIPFGLTLLVLRITKRKSGKGNAVA